MNIVDAIKLAIEEDGEIALFSSEQCINNEFYIKLKPFDNNLQLLEFYGEERKRDHFNLTPREIISNKWTVICHGDPKGPKGKKGMPY